MRKTFVTATSYFESLQTMFSPHYASGLGTSSNLNASHLVVLDASDHGLGGCQRGPEALHRVGIVQQLCNKGHTVRSQQVELQVPAQSDPAQSIAPESGISESGISESGIAQQVCKLFETGIPIFLGGTLALSLEAVRGAALQANALGCPLYVLKLTGHTQAHLKQAHLKQANLKQALPLDTVPENQICLYGLQVIKAEDQACLDESQILVCDVQDIETRGVAASLSAFLSQVQNEGGMLHVSFDPSVIGSNEAPGTLYSEFRGLSAQEARVMMQTLSESGLVTSLDVVGFNPAFDMGGRTARLIAELVATLFDAQESAQAAI